MSSLLPLIPDDDYQPIRALNDLLFCERRCALHRIEQVWVENQFTIEGTARHQRAHDDRKSEPGEFPVVRGMALRSDRLGLVGKADVVEMRPDGAGGVAPFPIEYKRGKRRRWDNDEVQLCAQALCLEEMLGLAVPRGAIFHIRSHRRREVAFDDALRGQTESTAARLHELIAAGRTPPPIYKTRCRGCSLLELCMPKSLEHASAGRSYQQSLYLIEPPS